MDNQKFNLFLDKLLEKTENGKLEWEKTADLDTLLLVLKDSAVSINRDFNLDKYCHIYTFDFRNENGNIDDSISISDKAPEYEKAERIFDLAYKQSLKSDKTFDRILEQIAA